MKEYIIFEDLANKIINYLATKPFIEVHEMVAGLQVIREHKKEQADNE